MNAPLPARVRRGYGLGGVATGAFSTVPGLLLLPYLTDTLGIGAAVAGLIVFAPKFWDVVLDPIAGRISDRADGPRGRRRPFLLWAGLLLAVCFAALFAGPTGSPALGGAYVVVVFIACATAFTFFQVPYVAMAAELTLDYRERTQLMTWRVIILSIAILASGAVAPMIVNAAGDADAAAGYRLMGVFVAGLIVAGTLGAYLATAGAPEHAVPTPAGGLLDQLRAVAEVAQFRWLWLTFVAQALAIGVLLAGVAYVARHLLDHAEAGTFLFAAFIGPALIVTPLWERYAEGRNKRSGYRAASVFLIVGTMALITAYLGPPGLVYVAAGVVGIGYAGAQVFPLAMLPDVAAHDAQTTGQNRTGVFTGVWTAGETTGFALGPALFALILATGGYVSSAAGETVAQPDSARLAIALGFSLGPAALVALSLLFLRRYSLDSTYVRNPDAS